MRMWTIASNLHPKVDLDQEGMGMEVTNTKVRWDKMERDHDLEGNDVKEKEDEKSKEEHIEDNLHIEVHNPDLKSLHLRKLTPSQIMNNPRVCLPKLRTEQALDESRM